MNALPEKLQNLQQNIFVDEEGKTYDLPEIALIETFKPLSNEISQSRFHPLCCFAKSAYYKNGYNKHEMSQIFANLNETKATELTKLRVEYESFLFVKYGRNRDEIHKHAVNDLLATSCEIWDRVDKSLTLLFTAK